MKRRVFFRSMQGAALTIYSAAKVAGQGTSLNDNKATKAGSIVPAKPESSPESSRKTEAEIFKLHVETFKLICEALAFASAAVFFAYKALAGYLISNLSIVLTSDRQPTEDVMQDYVTIAVQLKKGDRAAIALHDAIATLNCDGVEPEVRRFPAIRRLSSKDIDGGLVTVPKPAASAPLLNLPPGDETQFATFFKVPHGRPCIIDITVLGAWRWHGKKARYQWRASTVSLPVLADKAAAKI